MQKLRLSLAFLVFLVSALALSLPAAPAARLDLPQISPDPVVVERGESHKVWRRVTPRVTSYGKTYLVTNSYVEMATGMHVWRDGQLVEALETVEIVAGGAVARSGQHHAAWSANANTRGLLTLVASDQKVFRSHILGLAYTDAVSGRSVLIAEPKDCLGEVAGNQVVFRDAFDGPFVADVVFSYTRAGVAQDIIIREAVPPPVDYGLGGLDGLGAGVRLECWSEFLDPPAPTQLRTVLKRESDPARRAAMADPDLTDAMLDFGAIKIGTGRAFLLPTGVSGDDSAPVGKSWVVLRDGPNGALRTFLIEKVDYTDVAVELQRLPQPAAPPPPDPGQAPRAARAAPTRNQLLARLRGPAVREARAGQPAMRLAAVAPQSSKGFVLDYQTFNTGTNTNSFTFKSDTTYFITGPTYFTAPVVLESCVLKFTNGNTANRLFIKGPLDCRSDAWWPAICTGKDDDSVGETISGSTGNPTTNWYGKYLDLSGNTNVIDLHDLRVRRAYYGIQLDSASTLNLSHVQMSSNWAAVVNFSGQLRLRNVLIHDGVYAVGASAPTNNNQGEHVTFHRLTNLRSSGGMLLTNSLIISVTNGVSYIGANNYSNLYDAGVFQTSGWGRHYPALSSLRDAGNTNITPGLLADLKQRTTYPPVLVTSDITQSITWHPTAPRDTDLPDLGYHADALDHLITGGIVLSNATLLLTNGVVVGVESGLGNYGLRLESGATLISEGSPVNLNRFVRTHCVQETPSGAGTNVAPLIADTYPAPFVNPSARFRFTDFPMLPGSFVFHEERGRGTLTTLTLQDCQIRGGRFYLSGSQSNIVVTLKNCLFDRVGVELYDYVQNQFSAGNNLFREGWLALVIAGGSQWDWQNNLFDQTTLSQSGTLTHDFNGYLTNFTRLSPAADSDQILTNLTYEIGPLGRYYLPAASPLINHGSDEAQLFGLFHFTTDAGQLKETNSVVDIGVHWVALDSLGQPIDSDGDGWPDYLEDPDGDGAFDTGETDWNAYNSPFGLAGAPGIQVFTPLK